MKKKILISLFFLLVFSNSLGAFAKNNYNVEKIVDSVGDCKKDDCLSIVISTHKFDKSLKNADKINAFIKNELLCILDPEIKNPSTANIKDGIESVKKQYKEYKKDDKFGIGWTYYFNSDILYQNSKYLTLKLDQDTFSGGVHPNHYSKYATFDLNTGKQLTLKDLDKDISRLNKKVEKKFREVNKIPYGKKFEDFGFFITEKEGFQATDNFALTDKSVIFFYNQYAIAPYVMGTFEVIMPRKDFPNLK